MNNSLALRSLALVALLAATLSAQANYLIDPTGGFVLFDSTNTHDDEIVQRSLGGTLAFFGGNENSVYVSTNGNLNFTGTTSWGDRAFPSGGRMIAPFYDDLYIYQGSGTTIREKTAPGLYTVTWDAIAHYGNGSNSTVIDSFQAALFLTDKTVNGIGYQAGDIAFSYRRVDPSLPNDSVTVGLDGGNSLSAVPFGNGGQLSTVSALGQLPTDNHVVLFHPDGHGGYLTSFQAVPGPATFVALGLGAFGLLRRRRKA